MRIQKQDVKTKAQIIADGGLVSDLINDTQIYASVFSKTLDQAILDGDIGGASGAGSFTWHPSPSLPPMDAFVSNLIPSFAFSSTDTQEIIACITVPSNYDSGVQIFLKNVFGLVQSSGNVLLKCHTYLLKNNDPITLGSPYVSTVTQQSLSANVFRRFPDFDLTNSIGEIGSRQVSPNDILIIKLFRDVSNETSQSVSDFYFNKLSALPVFE